MGNFLKKLFSGEGKEKDPVCGMTVRTEGASFATSYAGKMFYFCSETCKKQFETDPGAFTDRKHS